MSLSLSACLLNPSGRFPATTASSTGRPVWGESTTSVPCWPSIGAARETCQRLDRRATSSSLSTQVASCSSPRRLGRSRQPCTDSRPRPWNSNTTWPPLIRPPPRRENYRWSAFPTSSPRDSCEGMATVRAAGAFQSRGQASLGRTPRNTAATRSPVVMRRLNPDRRERTGTSTNSSSPSSTQARPGEPSLPRVPSSLALARRWGGRQFRLSDQ